MSNELHFSNSPLTEAMIDIRVQAPETFAPDSLTAMQKGQEVRYPKIEERVFLEGQFSGDPTAPPVIGKRTHIGYDFRSDNGLQVFQASVNGFRFSRLKPYENWQAFQTEARRLWQIYREVVQPEAVTRLAVRYINRLDIPLPFRDLKDYLKTSPEVAPKLPQGLSGYFMQLQIPQDDMPWMLIINEAIVESPDPEKFASIVLDIDLFQDTDVPNDDDEMWAIFENLRHRKNDVFLACITEEMERLIH